MEIVRLLLYSRKYLTWIENKRLQPKRFEKLLKCLKGPLWIVIHPPASPSAFGVYYLVGKIASVEVEPKQSMRVVAFNLLWMEGPCTDLDTLWTLRCEKCPNLISKKVLDNLTIA